VALLSIKNLTTVFNSKEGQIRACNNVSLDIGCGKIVGLIGETGCGKSVLGMSILNLLCKNATTSGQIIYKGQDLLSLTEKELRRIRGKEIALLPQSPSTSLNPVLKIGEQISEGLQCFSKAKKNIVMEKNLKMLKSLGFNNPKKVIGQYPHQLSGGMKQRVLAALSISGEPSLLIADEPTKGLDAVLRGQVVELLRQLTRTTGTSLLLITHDLRIAAQLCDEIAVMYSGEIIENGFAKQVLNQPAHPYTQGLLSSLPEMGLHPIPGYSPSLLEYLPGCRFYSRCMLRKEVCNLNPISLSKVNGSYVRCLRVTQSTGVKQNIYSRNVQSAAV